MARRNQYKEEKTFTWVDSAHENQKLAYSLLYSNDCPESLGFGGGGGGAKTSTLVSWAWTECIRFPNFHFGLGRSELKRLKNTTLISYYEFLQQFANDVPKKWWGNYNQQRGVITFPNNSKIFLIELKYKPSDPLCTFLGSYLLTAAGVDESVEVNNIVMDTLYTRINRQKVVRPNGEIYKGRVLEVFNPDKGRVYNRFYKPYVDGKESEDIKFIPALVTDWLKEKDYYFNNGFKLHEKDKGTWYGNYIETLLKRDTVTRKRLLDGDFEYDDNPYALFDSIKVKDAFNCEHIKPSNFRIMSIDPAYKGKDSMVICIMRGFNFIELIVEWDVPMNSHQVVSTIKEYMRKYKIPPSNIIFDADGMGHHLESDIKGSKAFHGGSKPVGKFKKGEKRPVNLRTQCYILLSEKINKDLLSIDDDYYQDKIERDLSAFEKINIDDDLKHYINSKKDIRQKLGKSPDFADVLMMPIKLELSHQKRGSSAAA